MPCMPRPSPPNWMISRSPLRISLDGGGFLMFYPADRARLRTAMAEAGLQEVRFRFDFEGTKILAID